MKQCKDCKEFINDDASKCPQCGGDQDILDRFKAKTIEIVEIIQPFILLAGFALAYCQLQSAQEQIEATREQIEESNRQSWNNYLDQKSLELSKLAIENHSLGCIYRWGLPAIDESCRSEIFDSNFKIQSALEYTNQLIEHFREALIYSIENDHTYYQEWYQDWAEDLGTDPDGIVRYTLLTSSGCRSRGDCVYLAYLLGLCPVVDIVMAACFKWLDAGNEKFLSIVTRSDARSFSGIRRELAVDLEGWSSRDYSPSSPYGERWR